MGDAVEHQGNWHFVGQHALLGLYAALGVVKAHVAAGQCRDIGSFKRAGAGISHTADDRPLRLIQQGHAFDLRNHRLALVQAQLAC